MINRIKRKIDEDFITTFVLAYELGDLGILLPLDDRWSVPHGITEEDVMLVMVKGWTRESLYYDDKGINLTVVFGDKRNAKESFASFEWHEILAILDKDNNYLLERDYEPDRFRPVSIYDFIEN